MRQRLGHRGASLLLYGVVWLFLALSLSLTDPASVYHAVSLHVWAALFAAGGAVAIVSAFRYGPSRDRWGWIALSLTGSLWVARSLVVWVLWLTTHTVGDHRTWLSAAVWVLITLKINIDAGWNEPHDPREHDQ